MTNNNFRVALATKNGAYFLTPDEERRNWKLSEPFLKDENINKVVEDRAGNLFAASLAEGVFKSTDGGKTWKSSSKGLHVRKVWEVAPDPHHEGTVYAGTQYGHLFKSTDSGNTWDEVVSLHKAPDRLNWGIDWGFRTAGLALHTIKFDPKNPEIIYLVPAGKGTYRSDDGGETWKSLKGGTSKACNIPPEKMISSAPEGASVEERIKRHLSELHPDTHKIVVSPKDGRLYQQNHCGVYFSDSHGDQWTDVSVDSSLRFGLPLDAVETKSTNVFVIPIPESANPCADHNACIMGQVSVYGTSNWGKSWTKHSEGLPGNAHTTILRDCLTHDEEKDPGLYFGTTTGEVYFSGNLGESWKSIGAGLGRIQGLNVVVS